MDTNNGLNGHAHADETVELWRHPTPETTELYTFQQHIAKRHGVKLSSYHDLWQWSVQNPGPFWREIWEYTGIRATKAPSSTFDDESAMFPKPEFFAGCELNFAENLLFPASDPPADSPAIIAASEEDRETITWAELRERVRICAAAMDAAGISVGDRVAGYLAHHANTVVAMLAATSLGALWTGVSPDTGVQAVLDRLIQIEPVILFVDNAVAYNAKTHPTQAKVAEVVSKLPSLKNVVVFDTIKEYSFDLGSIPAPSGAKAQTSTDFLSSGFPSRQLTFKSLPPDHPVYILYSSGTTGTPKGIVHGALGTLLQHKKEHQLQCDIRPSERLFYFTTCTWMMWHWLVSGLASGATLILYDGSPFQPHKEMSMPLMIDELQINHFGTSAKYLSVLEQANISPRTATPKSASLASLKSIFSTGSPLAPSTFSYVYSQLSPPPPHPGLLLGSITGGTDIVSLFGAPCPLLPVHKGEIQARGLGMAIACYDASGKDISATGSPGELVCTVPFPCQPVMFWPPGEAGARRYQSSYFETYTNARGQPIWHHGHFVRFNPVTGGIHMLGRSDGVLNPSGVRFGSSEIYNVILKHFATEVEDALCIGRKRESDPDEVVVLFVKMAVDQKFTDELKKKIQDVVRKELSARHVPAVITETPEIPYTMNGKKVEGAVKQILCGLNIKTSASVANQECLEWYRTWAEEN
ncbi:acetoacetate-CoA ligase [Cyphellophora europaea CBS 101466]|uniref:Acetoacetate-CoA ligase n=1 Tax=Cyphellophora europaea (strain CBS 101466) TaxID=1220924 RepID=W2S8E1_CYPE1|nr:acetoacetate-CoA ligase [Cyphellophora europaea CBS 101466]ETN44932.1 acetoacetate-CoA ligase [Cyphellophora europaea CBS 101466]